MSILNVLEYNLRSLNCRRGTCVWTCNLSCDDDGDLESCPSHFSKELLINRHLQHTINDNNNFVQNVLGTSVAQKEF